MKRFALIFSTLATVAVLPAYALGQAAPPPLPIKPADPLTAIRAGKPIRLGVEDEFPLLKPTLVTLSVKDVPATEAAAALAKQTDFPVVANHVQYLGKTDIPLITLTLDKTPALEALFQFASQTGTYPGTSADGMRLYECEPGLGTGAWSVAGPFAHMIRKIDKEKDPPHPLAAGFSLRKLRLFLTAEPRLRVLAYPADLDIEIMQDERGNDLPRYYPPTAHAALAQQAGAYDTVFSFTVPENAGNKIKILRACSRVTIQTRGEKLQLPLGAAASKEFPVGRMSIHTTPLLDETVSWRADIVISRNDFPKADWAALLPVLKNLPTPARDDAGKEMPDEGPMGKADADTYTLMIRWRHDAGQRAPASLTIEIPTAVQDVIVPLVFRDLPLP